MAENYWYSSLSGQEIEDTLLGAVRFNADQQLTTSQKAAARANIGAGEANSTFKVLGYFNTLAEMQAALQTLPKLGDAYGIGTESPYDVYVYAMHMVDGQAVPGWVNQGPIDTSAAAFDDEDISVRTGWTSSKIASELTNVQRRLVIDDVPTLGSGNPVASGGVAVKMEWKKIVSENVSVPVNRWTSSTKYEGYGYRAQIPIENVTADMIPEVVLGQTEVSAGTFASVAETYNGGVYIYASEVPSAAITIPTIIVWRGDTGDGSDIPVIRVDPTLTVSGAAADAKAAGDAIRANATAIDTLQTTVDGKAGMLVDTASGAIASFVPDSTVPNLLGVTVDVEPVQDLHGYDNPWPAGGGKNLFDSSAFPSSASQNIIYLHYAVQNGVYTMSTPDFPLVGELSNVFFLAGSVSSGAISGANGVSTSTPRTITVTDGYYTVAYRSSNDTNKNNPKDFKWQIESGSTATSYAPYSNICPISGWSAVGIGATGINVWDEQLEFGYIYNGKPYASNDYKRSKNFVSVVPGATYYLRGFANDGQINFFDKAKAYKLALNFPSNRALTVPDGCYFIKFYNPTSAYDTPHSINYPSTDHAYHPYSGNTYTITIGQTVYGGTLDVDAGIMTVEWKKIMLGDYTLGKSVDNNFYIPTVTDFKAYGTGNVRYGQGKSNVFAFSSADWNAVDNSCTCYYNAGYSGYRIFMRSLAHSNDNASEFRSYLQSINAEFVYELATPITITLDPVTVSTISGQTNNVWADAGDVDVTYAADIKAYIDRMNQPTEDDMIANTLIAANKYFTVNNRLFLSTASIAAGAQIIPGDNCTETSLVDALNALNGGD